MNKIKKILRFFHDKTNKKIIFYIGVLILSLVLVVTFSAELLDTATPEDSVPSITIATEGWDEVNPRDGSWGVKKSAEWTGPDTAKITFDLQTAPLYVSKEVHYDVMFAIDVSTSMEGEKFTSLQASLKKYFNEVLKSDQNRIGMVEFHTTASVISTFTNDKDALNSKVDNLTLKCKGEIVGGVEQDYGYCTNYFDGLVSVEEALNGYTPSEDRKLVVLFLTDGSANNSNNMIKSQYDALKYKYPDMTIHGIQYEMGREITPQLRNASDYQYDAYIDNIYDVFFVATFRDVLAKYGKLDITDYISEDFYVESENKITTTSGNTSLTTENGTQKIVWNVVDDVFLTGNSAKMTIDVKLKDNLVGKKGLFKTNKNEVVDASIIDGPSNTIPSTESPILYNGYEVLYNANPPEGCNIKFEEKEIYFAFQTAIIKSDKLQCPGYLFKSWKMSDDTSSDVKTISDEQFIMPTHNVNMNGTWTKLDISKKMDGTISERITMYNQVKKDAKNGVNGATTLASTINDERPIYYYTQGREYVSGQYVYDPLPNNNVLFAGFCWQIVRTTETGGVKLVYNGVPSATNTCNRKYGGATAIGQSKFNENDRLLTSAGYMYGTASYSLDWNIDVHDEFYFQEHLSVNGATNYYFSKSYTLNGNTYTLSNPEQLGVWSSLDTSKVHGYYSCFLVGSTQCTTLYYVGSHDSQYYAYVLSLKGGQKLEDVDKDIFYSDEITKNANGTYTLSGTVQSKKQSESYISYSDKIPGGTYMCKDFTKTTCSDMLNILVQMAGPFVWHFSSSNNYMYGSSFTFDGTNYHLTDTITLWDYNSFKVEIPLHRYTCLNNNGICKKLYFILRDEENGTFDTLSLSLGKTVNNALTESLWDVNVNTNDSTIKKYIDNWYKANLTSYTNYLEDTIFCNDRRVKDTIYTGLNSIVFYKDSTNYKCINKNDRFTLKSSSSGYNSLLEGNQKLDYPIGLLTYSEIYNMGSFRDIYDKWFSMTPSSGLRGSITMVATDSSPTSTDASYSRYVRPAISLKPGLYYSSGNGTANSPYVIDLDS